MGSCLPGRSKSKTVPLDSIVDEAKSYEYYGEKIIEGLGGFGLSSNVTLNDSYFFLGYHLDSNCNGFGEVGAKLGIMEFLGGVKEREPFGMVRAVYSSDAEYIGIMDKQPAGKGKMKYSKVVSGESYKGFFHEGQKHYIGEEITQDWYYVGGFTNDCKGPFGKYKAVIGTQSYTYLGEYLNGEPNGKGILKLRYYYEEPLLQWNNSFQKIECIKKEIFKGEFENGIPSKGIRRTISKMEAEKNIDIQTNEFPGNDVLGSVETLQKTIKEQYVKLFDELTNFNFKEIIENHYNIDLIEDRIRTVRLKIQRKKYKESNVGMYFGKARLCGSINDIAIASYESFALRLLDNSFAAYANKRSSKIKRLYPELIRPDKIILDSPNHLVFNYSGDPQNTRKLVNPLTHIKGAGTYYYLLCFEYLKEGNFLDKLIKEKQISHNILCYIFLKTIYGLFILDCYGFFLPHLKLSEIYVEYDRKEKDIIIKFTNFNNTRIYKDNKLLNKWKEYNKLYSEILLSTPSNGSINEYQLNKLRDNDIFNDFINASEYKNKKSFYLPVDIKYKLLSLNWKDRLYRYNYLKLSIYSTLMGFLKGLAMMNSLDETGNGDFRDGTAYGKLQQTKILGLLADSSISFAECEENYKKNYNDLIEYLKIAYKDSILSIDLLEMFLNIEKYVSFKHIVDVFSEKFIAFKEETIEFFQSPKKRIKVIVENIKRNSISVYLSRIMSIKHPIKKSQMAKQEEQEDNKQPPEKIESKKLIEIKEEDEEKLNPSSISFSKSAEKDPPAEISKKHEMKIAESTIINKNDPQANKPSDDRGNDSNNNSATVQNQNWVRNDSSKDVLMEKQAEKKPDIPEIKQEIKEKEPEVVQGKVEEIPLNTPPKEESKETTEKQEKKDKKKIKVVKKKKIEKKEQQEQQEEKEEEKKDLLMDFLIGNKGAIQMVNNDEEEITERKPQKLKPLEMVKKQKGDDTDPKESASPELYSTTKKADSKLINDFEAKT